MVNSSWRVVLVVLTALLAVGPVPAQEIILPYNRAPETAEESWAAVRYEVNLGNHLRAAAMFSRFYDRLLARNEADQDRLLLRIYDTEGMSPFLRLANIELIRKEATARVGDGKPLPIADILVSRVTKLVEARLSDVARIQFFVKNLAGAPEERAYAITQLRQAGYRAVPAMVAVLRDPNQERAHSYVTYALLRMDSDVTPPLLAALDDNNPQLRTSILSVLHRRSDDRVIPALWWLRSAPDATDAVRRQASDLLAQFLRKDAGSPQGDSRAALTEYASRYYYPPSRPQAGENMVWRWDGKELASQSVTPAQYREYYGLYWARKALEIDPSYRPAQVLFLSLALEHAATRLKPGESLEKSDAQLAQVLAGAGGSLLEEVLDRAMRENRTSVALGAAKALARNGDAKLLRATEKGEPPLARALRYRDQRVRLAAAEAIVHIPQAGSFPGASRVVEVLRRALGGEGKPKALVGYARSQEGQNVAALAAPLGYATEVVTTGRDVARRANEDGDVSLIILDPRLGDPQLPYLLTELKNNPNTSALPVVIFADEAQGRRLLGQVTRYSNVLVLSPPPAVPEKLKAELDDFLKSPPLTADERKAHAKLALDQLLRIARGEVPGYDLRLADDAMARALADDELAAHAASVLALRPGRKNQQVLVEAALSPMRAPAVRAAALDAVRLNVQKYGILVGPREISALVQLPASVQEPETQAAAARLAALLQPDASGAGQRLRTFNPLPPAKPVGDAAPAADKEKPAEEKKDKNDQ